MNPFDRDASRTPLDEEAPKCADPYFAPVRGFWVAEPATDEEIERIRASFEASCKGPGVLGDPVAMPNVMTFKPVEFDAFPLTLGGLSEAAKTIEAFDNVHETLASLGEVRTLDVFLARHIMGDLYNARERRWDSPDGSWSCHEDGGPRHYSTDPAASARLWDRLTEMGWGVSIIPYHVIDRWQAQAVSSSGALLCLTASTREMAIAMAAKAIAEQTARQEALCVFDPPLPAEAIAEHKTQ